MSENILLKPCPFCGRKAIRENKNIETETKGLFLNLTTIRCEGKTHKTKDIKGCNVRCSASNDSVTIKMWNTRTGETNEKDN